MWGFAQLGIGTAADGLRKLFYALKSAVNLAEMKQESNFPILGTN